MVWPAVQVVVQLWQLPPVQVVPLLQKSLVQSVQPFESATQVSTSPKKPHWVAPAEQVPVQLWQPPFEQVVPFPQALGVPQPRQPEGSITHWVTLPLGSQLVWPCTQMFMQQVPT